MSCPQRGLWRSSSGVLEYWSHGVLEKNIAELERLFNMIDPHHPYSEFVQLQPPSKLLYREGGLMAVYAPRSKLRPKLSPSRWRYPPACKPYGPEAEPEANTPVLLCFECIAPFGGNPKPGLMDPDFYSETLFFFATLFFAMQLSEMKISLFLFKSSEMFKFLRI